MKKTLIFTILAIFGLSFFATANAATVNEAGMDWFDDMDEAKKAAVKSDKLIYIYFTGGVRCGWCVKMKKETFSDESVQKKVLKKFVIVMLNVWENPKQSDKELMAKYGGRGVPFNLVLDQDLELVSKFGGYKPAAAFIETMEGILEKYKETLEAKKELEKLLKKVEKKSGKNYKNYYKICMLYYEKLGKIKEAAEYAAKLLKNDKENKYKNNAQLNYIIGLQHIADKDNDKAKENFKEVKKIDNENAEGYYEQVIQLEMLENFPTKNWDAVIKIYSDFEKSEIKFHKDHEQTTKWYVAVAYLNKSIATQSDDDLNNARKYLKAVIKLDPDNPTGKQAAQYLKKIGDGNGF